MAKRYGSSLSKQERRDWNKETAALLKSRRAKPSAAGRRMHQEALGKSVIMRTVAALQAAQAKPDEWMALVLSSMGAEELRREIAQPDGKSADELRWMKAELVKKEKQ